MATCLAHGRKGLKTVAGHDEFTVNLVAHHFHIVLHANIVHMFQFFLCPYTSSRIMGVAEQEDGSFLIGTFLFKIFEIYLKAVVTGKPQHALKDLAAVVSNRGEEAIIVWRQDEHFLARHR